MIGTIPRDNDGKVQVPLSAYQPSEAIKSLTSKIALDFQVGSDLQTRPFTEFNDYSLLDRADVDQKRWNAYRQQETDNIDENWRYNGIRPITRNRILGIAAQMTARIVIPAPFAQNDRDEVDRMAALVMRDLMEYNIRNSNYVENYINWITDALVNPAAYLGVGFYEAMQTIKEENEGKITKRDVVDGVLSGFQTFNIPLDEILLGNYYTKQLDRQRFVIRRRYIDYDEAEALYGSHDNWQYVQAGIRTTFDSEPSMFYDVTDKNLQTLGEEIVYCNRREDAEIPFFNGIYLGDADTEANPIKHRDNENRPGYNFSVLGYEDISSRFFFFMSAARKLGDDDELVVRMEQLTVDATFLSVMPPTITTGAGQLSEAIMIPGKNTAFDNENVKVAPIQLGSAISAGWDAILKKEKDASESTQDPLMSGVSAQAKTATESALLAENAKIQLGRFGNMLVNSIKKLGNLMIDVILQHQTVMEFDEVVDPAVGGKFKSFILTPEGEGVTKRILFKPDMMGTEEITEDDEMQRSYDILNQEGGIDGEERIYEVNPEAWRKLKFYTVMDVKELLPPSILEMQNAANQMIQNGMGNMPMGQPMNPQKVGA